MKTQCILFICTLLFCTHALSFAEIDDAKLKEHMLDFFYADEGIPWGEVEAMRKQFYVSDEQIYRVLLELHHEADEKWSILTPKTKKWYHNRKILSSIIGWMPKLRGVQAKEFLLNCITSRHNDSIVKGGAVASYLRLADAEETRDVLLRFLVESERMDSQARSTLLWSAFETFGDSSPTKREAIVDSLCVALANEDNKWLFRVYDDILCQISDQYANSTQRRDILLKLVKAPALCKADEIALPELEKKRRTLKKIRLYTAINTNLTILKERNYTQPAVAGGYALSLDAAVHKEAANGKFKKMLMPGGWRVTLLLFCGIPTLSITILRLLIQKKRRAKATLKRRHEAK